MPTRTSPAAAADVRGSRASGAQQIWHLLGPAFVVSVAYVDPGNIAANLTAGARYGYLLLWVLVLANGMAVLVQYLSAKLGIVTGRSLAEHMAGRLPRTARLLYWAQAELVSAATDIAEVIGGAIALHILFGIPLLLGGAIIGAASMLLLALHTYGGVKKFQAAVVMLIFVITAGFLAGLLVNPPDPLGVLSGILPRFAGTDTVLLAASMLGATVMPHAIYLHSVLVRPLAPGEHRPPARIARLLQAARWDVVLSLIVAGSVNIGMLVLAASALPGVPGTDTIEGAHAAITVASGPVVGILFAVGLLASGLASTSIGAQAGSSIMADLLRIRINLLVRRLITLVPALVVLAFGVEPTLALLISQVVLSLGIPFALIPLMVLTMHRGVLGDWVNSRTINVLGWIVVSLIVLLNAALVALTLSS